jgi:DNA replication protein DnaC
LPRLAPARGTLTTPRAAGDDPRPVRDFVAEVRAKCPGIFRVDPPPSPDEIERRRQRDEERARRDVEIDKERCRLAFLQKVGRRYSDATLNSFRATTPEQCAVLAAIQAYANHLVERVRAGDGIVLFGPPGVGKDHLLIGLARAALDRGGRPEWVNGIDLYGRFRAAMDGGESEESIVRQYTRPSMLIVSDPIPPKGAVSDYQAITLYRILDERYRNCRPTWASLNVATAEEADARMGSAAVDRLTHGALVLKCQWPSYRRPAAREGGAER